MATNNITGDNCITLGLECEFVGTTCTTDNEIKQTVTCNIKNNICEYTYGCYIKHCEGEILTSVIFLSISYASMCIYCCYLLRNAFINKGKTRLDKLTFLALVLVFAFLARGFVVVLKKEDYDNTGFILIETASEIFQVSSAFYFVLLGQQLTTKAIIREKTCVITFLGKMKQVVGIVVVLLFVRLFFRLLPGPVTDAGSTGIRMIFLFTYFIVFACSSKMILQSQLYINKVKKPDHLLLIIQVFNKIAIGVFITFALWGLAFGIRTYIYRTAFENANGQTIKVIDPKSWFLSSIPSEFLEFVTYLLLLFGMKGFKESRLNKVKKEKKKRHTKSTDIQITIDENNVIKKVKTGKEGNAVRKVKNTRKEEANNIVIRTFNRLKKEYPLPFFICNSILSIASLLLYFYDIYTDLNLLVVLIAYGWLKTGLLSMFFIVLPYVIAMVGIYKVRKTAFKETVDWGNGDIKERFFYLSLPVLPFVFDILMFFYRAFRVDSMSDNFSNFMSQYEANRLLSESILEGFPQFCIQIYMISYCSANQCNFQDGNKSSNALMEAFSVSVAGILYRMGATLFEVRKENISFRDYLRQLSKMGDGIPLREIADNEIEHLDLSDLDLSLAQIRLLGKALQNNISLQWLGLKEMNETERDELLKIQHPVIQAYTFVSICEKGNLEQVKSFLDHYDASVTRWGVQDMATQGLIASVKNEHIHITRYLLEQGGDPTTVTREGWNLLHFAARFNKTSTDTLELLLNRMILLDDINCKLTESNADGEYEYTPLDLSYCDGNNSPIKKDISSLLRQHGGKANYHDKNGKWVGYGKGDAEFNFGEYLNHFFESTE
jgi:hypothetical protein